MKNIQQRMLTNLDIYRSANILVKQHGKDAPIRVATPALAKRHSHGGKTS